jgi:hypothetical protein
MSGRSSASLPLDAQLRGCQVLRALSAARYQGLGVTISYVDHRVHVTAIVLSQLDTREGGFGVTGPGLTCGGSSGFRSAAARGSTGEGAGDPVRSSVPPYSRNMPEIEHIFPRSELRRRNHDESDINDPANFWIPAPGENRNKRNRKPEDEFQ